MSVTFWCPNAPRRTVPCEFCADTLRWADLDGFTNDNGGHCDNWCNGTREESVAPEPNFANANAETLLRLLGWTDLSGECDGATMRQRIFKVRNIDRTTAVYDAYELAGGYAGTVMVTENGMSRIERRGARIISGGNTDQQTLRRLCNLEDLAHWAQDNDQKICWG